MENNFYNIFDSHAHYDDKWFDEDREVLLSSMKENGVCGIVNNAVDLKTAKVCIDFCEKYDFMYGAVGFHPENLEDMPNDYLDRVAELLKHKKIVAVGETGLDYHWDIPKDLQNRVFEEQIKLSLDVNMPIIVHDREAHGDTLNYLRKYKPKALVHCFSGSVEMMREVMRYGSYISLGGVVTFKNSKLSEVIRQTDLKKILLETDAPYLSPVPYRGRRNEPTYIWKTAEKVAETFGLTLEETVNATRKNTLELFKSVNKPI